MATSIQNNVHYTIDSTGDLQIRVVEYDQSSNDGNGNQLVLKDATFQVSRKKILENCESAPFKAMFGGPFKEGHSNFITLEDDTVASVHLWLRLFHGALNDEMYSLPIVEVWNTIAFGRKYLFHMDKLNPWYRIYWGRLNKNTLDIDDIKMLLFPSQEFDHEGAFAWVSKYLAHNGVGHIEEFNPTRFRDLHVEGRVIQQLNAARGSIRKDIIKALFNPLNCVCGRKCAVYEKSVTAYLDSIRKTGVWPIEDLQKKSNRNIVESDGFKNWTCKAPEGACMSCCITLSGNHVARAYKDIAIYWEGLCLDCMDGSKTKTGDLDTDYWKHNNIQMWDIGCRMNHKRNTWYFSYMGRPEIMTAFRLDQQQRKKEKNARKALEDPVALAVDEEQESDESDESEGSDNSENSD